MGVLSWKDSKHSLNNEKIILRGCVLRNTSWCFGMVIFAGMATAQGWLWGSLPDICMGIVWGSLSWMNTVLLFCLRCHPALTTECRVPGEDTNAPEYCVRVHCVRNHWHHEHSPKGAWALITQWVVDAYCLISHSLAPSQSTTSLYLLIDLPLKWGNSAEKKNPPALLLIL